MVQALADFYDYQVCLVEADPDGRGGTSSTWVLLTRNRKLLEADIVRKARSPVDAGRSAGVLWTDDFCSLLHVLK